MGASVRAGEAAAASRCTCSSSASSGDRCLRGCGFATPATGPSAATPGIWNQARQPITTTTPSSGIGAPSGEQPDGGPRAGGARAGEKTAGRILELLELDHP